MIKKRSETDRAETWSVEDLFATEDLWEAEYKRLEEEAGRYETFRGRLGESGRMLYDCLAFDETFSCALDRLYSYAHCQQDVDTTDAHFQGMYQRAAKLAMDAGAAGSYMSAEILAIPEERLAAFYQEVPELSCYKRTLDQILRDKPHTRSAEVEALLAEAYPMGRSPQDTFHMLNDADMRFGETTDENGEKVELTIARYSSLIQSQKRDVRREAFSVLYEAYRKQIHTLAANYTANIKQAAFFAKARYFASSRAHALAGSRIPETVYDQLIEAVHDGLPQMYRYVKLRKKALELSEVHLYDVYVPLSFQNPGSEAKEVEETSGEIEWDIPYEQACLWVKEALKPLGEDYGRILDEAFQNRWIDHAENLGKRSGAYSNGVYGCHPFVLMTYKNKLNDVFTLAHELGHSVHSYLSNRAQSYNNAQYRIFVAETASTCNEALLNHYLLERAQNPKERAYIINHFLDNFKGTLFRQTMFAEFERNMHRAFAEGIPLTAEYLCSEYKKLNELYFGPEMVVDEEIALEWARIPHFYRPFYVYQYATGFSAAIALCRRILEEGDAAVADYLRFLAGGCTKDPIELLKDAGVDMTSKQPVTDAMKEFEELLNQFETLF